MWGLSRWGRLTLLKLVLQRSQCLKMTPCVKLVFENVDSEQVSFLMREFVTVSENPLKDFCFHYNRGSERLYIAYISETSISRFKRLLRIQEDNGEVFVDNGRQIVVDVFVEKIHNLLKEQKKTWPLAPVLKDGEKPEPRIELVPKGVKHPRYRGIRKEEITAADRKLPTPLQR